MPSTLLLITVTGAGHWIYATYGYGNLDFSGLLPPYNQTMIFFWNQANVRAAGNRGTVFLIGLPRFFLVFQTRFGSRHHDPSPIALTLWDTSASLDHPCGSYRSAAQEGR